MKKYRYTLLSSLFGIFAILSSLIPTAAVHAAETTYDDRDTGITYTGSWAQYDASGPYNGTTTYTSSSGAIADFTFTGVSVALLYTTNSHHGQARILIDAIEVDILNLYSASGPNWQQRWDSPALTSGQHTIQIQHYSGGVIDIDAIIVSDTPLTPSPTPTGTPMPRPGVKCQGHSGGEVPAWDYCAPDAPIAQTITLTGADQIKPYEVTAGGVYSYFDIYVENTIRVYYDIYVTYKWMQTTGYPLSGYGLTVLATGVEAETPICYGSGGDGSGNGICHYTGYFDVGDVISGARFTMGIEAVWPHDFVSMTAMTAKISAVPIPNCSRFITTWTEDLDIIPTVEIPMGVGPHPNGEPADAQKLTLATGQLYRLAAQGAWNDGTEDRKDKEYVVSFDDQQTWIPYNQIVTECDDMDGLIFLAETPYFSIRVDDTTGAFADNTDLPGFDTRYKIELVQLLTECSQKFSYDPEKDLLYLGAIDATSSIPMLLPTAGSVVTPTPNPLWTPIPPLVDQRLDVGGWYALETYGAPWSNGVDDQFELKVMELADNDLNGPFNSTEADEMSVWPYTTCVEATGELLHKRYYFQAPNDYLAMWVNSTAFMDNSGSLAYRVYHVSQIDIPDDCESEFDLSTKVADWFVDGKSDAGNEIILAMPNQWYMLLTKDGPWQDNGGNRNRWDIEWSDDNGAIWWDIEDWPGVYCFHRIDAVGHIRAYFRYESGQNYGVYRIRVNDQDNNFSANTGSIGYEIWGAVPIKPPDSACDGTFAVQDDVGNIDVNPQLEAGVIVPSLLAEQTYALTTIAWWHEGADDETRIMDADISDDNGETWYPWDEYPGGLCFESYLDPVDVLRWRLFIKAQAGRIYRARASDVDENFLNNIDSDTETGYGVKISNATVITDPFNECAKNYTLTLIKSDQQVPSQSETGARMEVTAGQLYAVDVVNGSWKASSVGNPQYNAQLSFNDGEDFYDFDDRDMPGWQCFMQKTTYQRIYFLAANDGSYAAIRVSDSLVWTDNLGELRYDLYGASGTGPGPCTNCQPPGQYAGCYVTPVRPGGLALGVSIPPFPATSSVTDIPSLGTFLLAVFGWVGDAISASWTSLASNLQSVWAYFAGYAEYVRVYASVFFLWCPEHTAVITNLYNEIAQREPFLTFANIAEFVSYVKAKVESYTWTIGENAPAIPFTNAVSGSSSLTKENQTPSLLQSLSAAGTSPYNGGMIDLRRAPAFGEGLLRGASSITGCNARIKVTWGNSGISAGFCMVMNLVKMIGLSEWLNLMIVITCVILFLSYLGKTISPMFKPAALLTGSGKR